MSPGVLDIDRKILAERNTFTKNRSLCRNTFTVMLSVFSFTFTENILLIVMPVLTQACNWHFTWNYFKLFSCVPRNSTPKSGTECTECCWNLAKRVPPMPEICVSNISCCLTKKMKNFSKLFHKKKLKFFWKLTKKKLKIFWKFSKIYKFEKYSKSLDKFPTKRFGNWSSSNSDISTKRFPN